MKSNLVLFKVIARFLQVSYTILNYIVWSLKSKRKQYALKKKKNLKSCFGRSQMFQGGMFVIKSKKFLKRHQKQTCLKSFKKTVKDSIFQWKKNCYLQSICPLKESSDPKKYIEVLKMEYGFNVKNQEQQMRLWYTSVFVYSFAQIKL